MKHPLSFLSEAIKKTAITAFNAIESVQTAPIRAGHAFLGSDPVLEKGDHIMVYCGYMHHGLYIGNNMVIHYTKPSGKGRIQIDSLETFKNGKSIEKRQSNLRRSRDAAVSRAYSRLGEAEYNLIFKNCEHFVNWCRNG
ncbi:hypothetical protein PCCS19_36040 [Paenibacillus sp. CCS19]|uniref:lecithin retinol acyltransferase family protein n=1 Tax=Paenibacillus sp. CCS19 TaxID=3158387 RepID=UPI00256B432B|nr:lecithin retinol acyltransferase family protein [Paenibacillus cellulosilyticus]GMK40548.1 hypothetical protein PCCS19_36040 [Paenibacillus cellulosilyticus]